MKFIILCSDKRRYTFPYVNEKNIMIYDVYKNNNSNFIIKIIRKILYFLGFYFFGVFYGEWKKYKNENNIQLIVFDECKPYHRLYNFLSKFNNKPIVYFWNPIENTQKISNLKRMFNVFSYSLQDSKKYDVKYNQTFIPFFGVDLKCQLQYSIIFVGKNKGRLILLEEIYKMYPDSYFWVTKDGNETSDFIDMKSKPISYYDYIEKLKSSVCVLEILASDTAGYTLRTAEAVIYGKKLITNNKEIIKDKLYKNGNILVIDGGTTKDTIDEFLSKDFSPYNDDQINQFMIQSWIERFDLN